MSRMFLVRHGQASFSEPNYDKLSATGEAQARLLGQYWVRHNVAFDSVCSGPRVRQGETARIVFEAYRNAGVEFPQPVVMQEFDEYQGDAVLERSLPGLIESNSAIREHHRAYQASGSSGERRKHFQRLFEVAIAQRVSVDIPLVDLEGWTGGCA